MATSTKIRIPRSLFLDAVRKSGLLPPDDIVAFFTQENVDDATINDPIKLATLFVRKKLLTKFQAMQLLKGKTQGFLLGNYRVLEGIRQDRVGMVFLAEHRRNKNRVSLKVLPSDRASDEMILREFTKEVRLAARIEHTYVARVLDMDVVNGINFVVSEYVPGPTLDKVIAAKGPLAPNAAAQFVAQVAVGLRLAHGRNLLHRDIKPANIALTGPKSIKLIDLGLTHMLESPWQRVTKRISTKEFAEEIDHVAPEQAWGQDLDVRGDIYSLGSTMYSLLTGQSPFPGTAAEKMTARQLSDVPKPSLIQKNIPRELDAVVQKMGARDPIARYQSAEEVLVALHAWLPFQEWLALGVNLNAAPVVAERTGEKKQLEKAKTAGFLSRVFRVFRRN